VSNISLSHSKSFKMTLLSGACVSPYQQGDHLSGKPRNVGEFDSCQGNVQQNILLRKSYLKLFIVNCIYVSITALMIRLTTRCYANLSSIVFSTSMGMIWVTLNMPSAVNCQGISHCLESGHPVYTGWPLFTENMSVSLSISQIFSIK